MTNINSLRAVFNSFDAYALNLEFYRALNLAEEIVKNVEASLPRDTTPTWQSIDPVVLQNIALAVPSVRQYILEDKKIHAIKELKLITSTGLKEAKDAVEAVVSTVKGEEAIKELRERLGQ